MNIFARSQHWLNSATLQTGNSRDSHKEDSLYFCLPKLFIYHHSCVYALRSKVIFSDPRGFIVGEWHRSGKWFFREYSHCSGLGLGKWMWTQDILTPACMGWMTKGCDCLVAREQKNDFRKRNFCKLDRFPRCLQSQNHTMTYSWEFGVLF